MFYETTQTYLGEDVDVWEAQPQHGGGHQQHCRYEGSRLAAKVCVKNRKIVDTKNNS